MHETSSPVPSLRRILGALIILLLGAASGACDRGTPNSVKDTIGREVFVDLYVDLRSVALRRTTRRINAAERDSVLAMHEVTLEDLRLFLEVYQADAEYMRDLWNDVEARISLILRMAGEGSERDG